MVVSLCVQVYITCVIGVQFVGFLTLTLSLATGITACISGHLQQYIGRMPLILTGLFHCLRTSCCCQEYIVAITTYLCYDFVIMCYMILLVGTCSLHPLSSTRQHPSYGDCLEVKREYYQNSSVLDCVTVFTVRSTLM